MVNIVVIIVIIGFREGCFQPEGSFSLGGLAARSAWGFKRSVEDEGNQTSSGGVVGSGGGTVERIVLLATALVLLVLWLQGR